MATIAVVPLVMKDVLLSIGSNEYKKHVSGVVFTPSFQTIRWHGLDKTERFTDQSAADWVCDLTFVQDWATTDSLSKYLFANEGTSVVATFTPKGVALGPTFTSTLIIAPGTIGGQVDSYAESTVSLGCSKPVLAP